MSAAAESAAPALERLQQCLAVADPSGSALPARGSAAALEAGELAQGLGLAAEQGLAGARRCSQLLRLGDYAAVLAEAPAALVLLTAPAALADRCELLRVLTLAACETAAFDVALDAAHEVVRTTASLADDGLALGAATALASAFERMGDSWQAVRLLSDALRSHGGGAPDMALLVATNGMCAISIGILHRLLGTGADAEVHELLARARAAGEQARAILQRVLNPAYQVAVLANLGEVMLHQGETQAAEPLLRDAHRNAVERGLHAHSWRVQTTLGDWLMASGRPIEALAAMQRLLETMGSTAPPQTALRAHHVAYRACRALGNFADALAHFEEVERSERRRAVAQLRAQSRLFVTRTEAQHAQWQAEQARLDAATQRQRAAEFAASAERDPLTGLGNRRHLERRCAELMPQAQREERPLALAQIDIDNFKLVNDRHGHAAGDRVLVAMAQLLRENTRTGDVLARHGGEEFVVILPDMGLERAAEVCERLRERVAAHGWGQPDGPAICVTISIGLAAAAPYDAAALMQSADNALYRAKRSGRNRLCLQGQGD